MVKQTRKIIKEETIEDIEKNSLSYLTIDSKDIDKIKEEFALKVIFEHNTTVKFLSNLCLLTIFNPIT